MKADKAILKLGARHGIESPHTVHVARLAADLFDGFLPPGCNGKRERNILLAAARLHDIGYAEAPDDHVEAGARILAGNRIDTFSSDEWLEVVALVLLHRRDWKPMLDHPLLRGISEDTRLRIHRLAALLRIADGLDHGHLQDARILECRSGRKTDHITVECRFYAGNVSWARGKADLWEAAFRKELTLRGRVRRYDSPYRGIIRKQDATIPAARRLLYAQWDVMRDNVPGILSGDGPECLHAYRVAMRRFRAALRLFRPLMDGTKAQLLRHSMGELSDALSPARDIHVAWQVFNATVLSPDALPEVREVLRTDLRRADSIAWDILDSADCRQMAEAACRFLRVELPELESRMPGPPFNNYIEKRLRDLLKKIRTLDVSQLRAADPAGLHEVRKLCRRGRYAAEFASVIPVREIQLAAKHLKGAAGALGEVRDIRIVRSRFDLPEFDGLLDCREEQMWMVFQKAWRRLSTIDL